MSFKHFSRQKSKERAKLLNITKLRLLILKMLVLLDSSWSKWWGSNLLHSPGSTLALGVQIRSCISLKTAEAHKFKWALSCELLVLERCNFLQISSVSLLYSGTKFEKDPRAWIDVPSN